MAPSLQSSKMRESANGQVKIGDGKPFKDRFDVFRDVSNANLRFMAVKKQDSLV